MLGERVKIRRKELGLTQKKLAEAIQVSQGQLSQLENGDIGEIQTRRLKALAQALHVSADWLLELESVA